MTYTRLGDLLLSVGLITQEQLDAALRNKQDTKYRLGQQLIADGAITEQQLTEALVMQLGMEFIDLSKIIIPTEMAQVLAKNLARKHGVVPVRISKNTLYLAMSDPMNFVAVEEVKTATRKQVIPLIATADAIERAISTLYGSEGAARAIEEMKREMAADTTTPAQTNTGDNYSSRNIGGDDAASAPTIRLVNSIIERAIVERASDIHLEPYEEELRVRMRIDGMMRNVMVVPKDLQSSVISRLKIMGGMDISERRVPQDGRSAVSVRQKDYDLRMSTLPTIYGEKFVIRILDKSSTLLNKDAVGLAGADLEKYEKLLEAPSGVILVAGPTGSGKSSTMYTMIRELNTEQVNLITLEDPVEYNIMGINQVQINEKIGMTFASGLRSILRQDPDVIAVGEIRDGETAEIAMRAAVTGHLVISTIHTNAALATIDRLLDIGVEPYLISAALNGVVSQRLVRRICPNCRTEYEPTAEELESLALDKNAGHKFYKGKGCPNCFGTGYRGRTGVFEILVIDRAIRTAISNGIKQEELLRIAKGTGKFVTMAENCRRLVLEGITTVSEAKRTIGSVEIDL